MIMQKYMSKQFWENVRNDSAYKPLIDETVFIYEKNDVGDLPSLTYTSRRAFMESGDRAGFELNYFKRRARLISACVLSLIYPEKDEYIDEINNIIWAICEEYSWVVPAHTDLTLERDLGIIELFCAGTAGILSEVCCFLEDRLDKIVIERAKAETRRRVFDIFENKVFGWEHGTNNWAAVCTGNVATAMMYWDKELAEKNMHRFVGAAESFLSGFYDDGACLEGINYWGYGFGNFLWLAENIAEFTEGKINLFDNPKVKKIGMYAQNCFMKGSSTVSFSDGRQASEVSLSMMYFLHGKYGDDIKVPPMERMTLMHVRPCWNFIIRAFAYFDKNIKAELDENKNYFYDEAHQYVADKKSYSFAVKAGHNDEPHNHNDVGSFIIATRKGQRVVDLGAGEYTRQYFRDETRYGFICCSSRGHNVPVINGEEQKAGIDYCGTLEIDNGVIKCRMEKAYGLDLSQSVARSFVLEDDRVVITDEFSEGITDVCEHFVLKSRDVVLKDGVCDAGDVTISVPKECKKVNIKPISFRSCRNERLDEDVVEEIYTLVEFILKENTEKAVFEFKINE